MLATLPPTVKHASAVGHMSKERVVKGIEQTWCRASKSARGDGKFAAAMQQLLPDHTICQEMSAAPPPTVIHASAVGHMSKGRVVKGIEHTWCRASKATRGNGKFAATMQRLLSSTPVLGIAFQPLNLT